MMMTLTRQPLIRDFSSRGACHLSGAIAELCSLGQKSSIRMAISDLVHFTARSEMNDPRLRKPIHPNQALSLDGVTIPGAIIPLI